jgi:uncharacterized protein
MSLKLHQGALVHQGIQITKFSTPDKTNKSTRKSSTPENIKIQLGFKCNFSCSYCLQTPEKVEHKSFVPVLSNINLSQLKKIELWGGEPLLYLDSIIEILDYLQINTPNIKISMVTNISLLNKDILSKLSEYSFSFAFGLSHDGPKQAKLRSYISEQHLVDMCTLMDTYNFEYHMLTMLSKDNYNLLEIDGYFRNLLPSTTIVYDFIEPHDEKSLSQVVGDLENFGLIMTEYLDNSENNKTLMNNFYHFSDSSVLGVVKSLLSPTNVRDYGDFKCSIDNKLSITIDNNGLIKSCQNSSKVIGTSIQDADLDKILLTKRDECNTCEYLNICGGVCPYISDNTSFIKYCSVKKVFSKCISDKVLELIKKESI